jgi:Na+-driven multidrug efflux pump
MGAGVSSAVARAIGAGKPERANALVFHAFLLALALGAIFAGLMLFSGSALFRLMNAAGRRSLSCVRWHHAPGSADASQAQIVLAAAAWTAMAFVW